MTAPGNAVLQDMRLCHELLTVRRDVRPVEQFLGLLLLFPMQTQVLQLMIAGCLDYAIAHTPNSHIDDIAHCSHSNTHLWKTKVGGRSYLSCANTSADLAFSCCTANFCRYCRVDDLCREYTDPLEICRTQPRSCMSSH